MTPETCRCGAHLKPADSNWLALDGERPGDFWCPDGRLHEPRQDLAGRWKRLMLHRVILARLLNFAGALLLGCLIGAVTEHRAPVVTALLAVATVVLMTPHTVMAFRPLLRSRRKAADGSLPGGDR